MKEKSRMDILMWILYNKNEINEYKINKGEDKIMNIILKFQSI